MKGHKRERKNKAAEGKEEKTGKQELQKRPGERKVKGHKRERKNKAAERKEERTEKQ